jgi:cytochrome c
LKPGQQLTGPSLAAIWQRPAASVPGFHRYSDALKRSTLVWDERTLDMWLKNPTQLIPGSEMAFPGIPGEQDRRNLIAFLRGVGEGRIKPSAEGMGGGMRTLGDAQPDELVTKITYCGDAYRVTTASGKTRTLWEFNLRFKTDSSSDGPREGHPVLLAASMRGDRAFVIFARPEEISTTVRRAC